MPPAATAAATNIDIDSDVFIFSVEIMRNERIVQDILAEFQLRKVVPGAAFWNKLHLILTFLTQEMHLTLAARGIKWFPTFVNEVAAAMRAGGKEKWSEVLQQIPLETS
ncbi:hypothetical protein OF83DRAFT_1174999 [Amylostereum chailletii]|nr:hypothetical protein OF83DRAFT_1174999 [Amylostereum chailletii]